MEKRHESLSYVRQCYLTGGYVFAKKADSNSKQKFREYARLASNENPTPPPTPVLDAIASTSNSCNRYPDETSQKLILALQQRYGNSFAYAVSGTGMDGIIETIVRIFVGFNDNVVISSPTFSFYGIAVTSQGGSPVYVGRREDFSIDPETIARESGTAKLVILCTPNNPTGNATPVPVIEELLKRINCPLFLDNAYIEFSHIDYTPLLLKYDNLIIGRTFSKAYSLAGMRIGFAFLPQWLEKYYKRAMTPFNLSTPAEAAAVAALKEREHILKITVHVRQWLDKLAKLVKFPVLPSDANFVMINVYPHTSDEAVDYLREQGVLTRSCSSFSGLPDHYIRVSIGDDWEMERFINAINSL